MLTDSALLWTEIAAGVCLFFAAMLAWGLLHTRNQIKASAAWPVVPGTVIVSQVDGPGARINTDDSNCKAVIRYRYQTGGKTFESDRVKIGGDARMTQQMAEELCAKYPLGAKIDVHHDPHDRAQAVLEPGNKSNLLTQAVFMSVFAAIGLTLTSHAIAGKVLYTAGGLPMFAFLMPVAAILVGVGGIAGFFVIRRTARNSAQWPATTGKITTSKVSAFEETDRDDDNTLRTRTRYRADIRYAYRVGQRDYHGTTVSWGWTSAFGAPAGAQAIIAKYPLGRAIPVHYDPADPANGVLDPQGRSGTTAPLVFGSIFSGVGLLLLWVFVGIG